MKSASLGECRLLVHIPTAGIRDPGYSASEKFLLFPILAAILNFDGSQIYLFYEWLNSLYVRLDTVLSEDTLR